MTLTVSLSCWVRLEQGDSARSGVEIDICQGVGDGRDAVADRWSVETGWDANGGTVSSTRMACSFQDEPALHGRDFCDIEWHGKCRRRNLKADLKWFYWRTLTADEAWARELGDQVLASFRPVFCFFGAAAAAAACCCCCRVLLSVNAHAWQGLGTDHSCEIFDRCSVANGRSRRASHHMTCSYTPLADQCRADGWLQPLSSIERDRRSYFRLYDDPIAGKDVDISMMPWYYDKESDASLDERPDGGWSLVSKRLGDAFGKTYLGSWMRAQAEWLNQIVPDAPRNAMPLLSFDESDRAKWLDTRCPAHIRTTFDDMRDHSAASETIPQEHSLHSMCHRVDDACHPDGAFMRAVDAVAADESPCAVGYAQVPPGVAARFFATVKPAAEWPSNQRRPVWSECPHAAARVQEHTFTDARGVAWTVPYERKSHPEWYTGGDPACTAPDLSDADIIPCTAQDVDAARYAQCTGERADDGCYVFDATSESEWFREKSQRCREVGGACFYSLTLAQGVRCGTATLDADGKFSAPPDFSCPDPAKQHKFVVRGSLDTRSLWKCDECLKHTRENAFRGRMNCGIPRASSAASTTPYATVISGVRAYVRDTVHSLSFMRDLHIASKLAFNGDPALPFFFDGPSTPLNDTAFVPLDPLSFAPAFASWGENPATPCCPAPTANAQAEECAECPWQSADGLLATENVDRLYISESAKLQCALQTPSLHEYKRCPSPAGASSDTPRVLLADWVQKHYRSELGAWLPVLERARGTSWALDRTATAKPFTLLYASAQRPLAQRHAAFLFSDAACMSGAQESSICAVFASGKNASVVNPWLAGEFNIGERNPDRSGMGLDHCTRSDGVRQVRLPSLVSPFLRASVLLSLKHKSMYAGMLFVLPGLDVLLPPPRMCQARRWV